MSPRKGVVTRYIEGFRRTDHDEILGCLHDEIVWVLHGYKTLRGKAAFDDEIENETAVGPPVLELDRLIEEGDVVVAVGHGQMTLNEVGDVRFVFIEVFAFDADLIKRIETFHINIAETPEHDLLRAEYAGELALGRAQRRGDYDAGRVAEPRAAVVILG